MKAMNLSGVDLNLLVVFQAILQEKNLTRAGESIGLSQPAVSSALGRLRDILDDPLFIRTAEGMLPTPKSEQLAEPVGQALELLRNSLQGNTAFTPETSKKKFRIAMTDNTGAVVLPRLVEWMKENSPNVDLVIRPFIEAEAQQRLKSGKLDLVITTDITGAGLYQKKVYEDRYVSLVNEGHPLSSQKPTLDNYIKSVHACFSPVDKNFSIVDRVLAEKGVKRKISLTIPHISVLPFIIANNNLVATLPYKFAKLYAGILNLKIIVPPLEIPGPIYFQYWHEKNHNDPANKWLRGVISNLGLLSTTTIEEGA